VHSAILGAVLYAWVHRLGLPSGATKRRLLALLLVLPLVTAAVPGRSTVEFGERVAWLNSARLLAVPLAGGLHVHHVVVAVCLLALLLTLWQEVLPALRHPRLEASPAPPALASLVRTHTGWERCEVAMADSDAILVATGGWPWRPRLIVSRGALAGLSEAELQTVVRHEHAHWTAGQWVSSHALFVVRMAQAYNPVALWAFREYCNEVEIACDAVAVRHDDPRQLAGVLLRIYRATDRRDVAARGALRKRIDVLLGGGPQDASLPPLTVSIVSVVMLLVLPWIV
jgi:Zn-dependent protease with chaperone function